MEHQGFSEAVKAAEERFTRIVGEPCTISIYSKLNDNIEGIVKGIETQQFRKELRYSHEEFLFRSRKKGFTLIMVRGYEKTLAFFFGYEDEDLPGGFYGDTLASLIEGKGLGTTLFTIVHLYCYFKGYSHFTCNTEERDEKGRRLREWYKATGMEYIKTDPKEGDLMRVRLTKEHITWMYRRFILGDKNAVR